MLNSGLAALAVAVVMAANGCFSATAFGVGAGLLFLWYLSDRDSEVGPATEEELFTLADSLHESSTEFDLPDFVTFLRRIRPYITKGFGEREASKLNSLAEHLPHNRETQTEFQVVFDNLPVPLRVRLFKHDGSSVAAYFFTSEALAELLDREMESFFAERKI